jgi:hypothetical protein
MVLKAFNLLQNIIFFVLVLPNLFSELFFMNSKRQLCFYSFEVINVLSYLG